MQTMYEVNRPVAETERMMLKATDDWGLHWVSSKSVEWTLLVTLTPIMMRATKQEKTSVT